MIAFVLLLTMQACLQDFPKLVFFGACGETPESMAFTVALI